MRDISRDTVVQDFLKNNKVYVSVTTSPKRIQKIYQVFETLDLKYIERIFVNLPIKYERDNSEYKIPKNFKDAFKGKIQILRFEKDLGPITKLIPAAEFLLSREEKNAAIITIDDDMSYPIGMINEMILALAYHPERVFAGSTHALSFWGIDEKNIPPVGDQVIDHSVVEGFAGVAYMVPSIDIDLMKKFADKNFEKKCFISDDLVISFALGLSQVIRSKIDNDYFKHKFVHELSYAKEADALSKGAGMDEEIPNGFDVESAKYRVCHQKLMEFTFDQAQGEFQKVDEIIKKHSK